MGTRKRNRAGAMNLHGVGGGGGGDPDDQVERGGVPQPGEQLVPACGERIRVSTLRPMQYCLLCCCPCCLGPPCSSNRKTNYINMLKTFAAMIVLVCLVMMVVELAVGGVVSLDVNPMVGPSGYTLAQLGSSYGWRMQYKWEVYRLFSPIFLHGGLLHLAGNMLFLVFLGVPLEQTLGWRKFAALFFLSGLFASLFSVCIHPNTISVGASGALFGLLGGALTELVCLWSTLDPLMRRIQLIQQLVIFFFFMFISFGVKYIDGWAHLGGLIGGFIIGAVYWTPMMESRPLLKSYGRPMALGLGTLVSLVLLGLFFGRVIATSQLFAPAY